MKQLHHGMGVHFNAWACVLCPLLSQMTPQLMEGRPVECSFQVGATLPRG